MLFVASTAPPDTGGHDSQTLIVIALISLMGVTISGLFGLLAARWARSAHDQAAQANDAVNHKGEGQERLFDMVADTYTKVKELDTWKDQWDELPEALRDPANFAAQFDKIDGKIDATNSSIHSLNTHLGGRIEILGDRVDGLSEQVSDVAADLREHIDRAVEVATGEAITGETPIVPGDPDDDSGSS